MSLVFPSHLFFLCRRLALLFQVHFPEVPQYALSFHLFWRVATVTRQFKARGHVFDAVFGKVLLNVSFHYGSTATNSLTLFFPLTHDRFILVPRIGSKQ